MVTSVVSPVLSCRLGRGGVLESLNSPRNLTCMGELEYRLERSEPSAVWLKCLRVGVVSGELEVSSRRRKMEQTTEWRRNMEAHSLSEPLEEAELLGMGPLKISNTYEAPWCPVGPHSFLGARPPARNSKAKKN